jgi:dephospho-CoA kinase
MTFVLGLTGSVGMGKSATATLFRAFGVPVHDADASVHALYRGAAVAPVAVRFPEAVVDGTVDRARLGQSVFGDASAMRDLEAIIHPLVREEERAFLARVQSQGAPLAILDVPLLLETGGDKRCDAVLVVTAPSPVQKARVMARPGMTEERFGSIMAKQMPDREKRKRAHFLLDTSRGFGAARDQVRSILACLAARPGRVIQQEKGLDDA